MALGLFNYKIMSISLKNITTKDQARQYAIDWQSKASDKNLSYSELLEERDALMCLAKRFDLIDEFKENGII